MSIRKFKINSVSSLFSNSKRRREELKKKKLDQLDSAKVYEEFCASFNVDNSPAAKIKSTSFVSGGFIGLNSDSSKVGKADANSKLPSKPMSSSLAQATRVAASLLANNPLMKKNVQIKKPTNTNLKKRKRESGRSQKEKVTKNIDSFMEEMKRNYELREQRTAAARDALNKLNTSTPQSDFTNLQNIKHGTSIDTSTSPNTDISSLLIGDVIDNVNEDGYYREDPLSTNVYISNLPPHVTELNLLTEFGKFGPIGSVKIMWPRTDEERARRRNIGFINFMNRKDASDCLDSLTGKDLFGTELRIGQGKKMATPAHPLPMPGVPGAPVVSGVPGVSQPVISTTRIQPTINWDLPKDARILKIKRPLDQCEAAIIDAVAQKVFELGYRFEQCVAEEFKNCFRFKFLFEVESVGHIYYRWRLYSLLNGDSFEKQRSEPFQIISGGPYQIPPLSPQFQQQPLPIKPTADITLSKKESANIEVEEKHENKSRFSDSLTQETKAESNENQAQLNSSSTNKYSSYAKKRIGKPLRSTDRDNFESMLRNLTDDRNRIKQAMVFCIDNSEKAIEIVEIITEALTIPETEIPKKVSRLYLVSDILHNCNASVRNSSAYRSEFQRSLKEIFSGLNVTYSRIQGRLTADKMKESILGVLRVQHAQFLFPLTFLIDLEALFLLGRSTTLTSPNNTNFVSSLVVESHKSVGRSNNGHKAVNTEALVSEKGLDDADSDIDGVPLSDLDD